VSVPDAPWPPTVERLVEHLFDGAAAEQLARELGSWLAGSSRFRGFAEAHRDKIRKKLRGATDAEARRDVRTELRVAHLLLADRRMELAFEAYGSAGRGPDFTMSFRGERDSNVEVTRLRRAPDEAGQGGQLLAKLRQLPPGVPNLLIVAVEGADAAAFDVAAATRALRSRADAKDEAFFVRRGFRGTRGFYDRFLRLGAVIGWAEGAPAERRAAAWTNGSARLPLPERALRACLACLGAGHPRA
jgi:hypothetical protein